MEAHYVRTINLSAPYIAFNLHLTGKETLSFHILNKILNWFSQRKHIEDLNTYGQISKKHFQ